ncbi:protein of unknown function [Pseudobutyrivibrio sp. YE44]|uniref:DUF4340 domain-containing protein n=1 Tax=Pseudobutyrivibrio sp. YE44 TaxID=1520802 RepID=UPI00087FD6C8|nr:DUF4340 domain-containing protein [Pseudobutyrivibrio sp. YE44]SDB10094.1 protein of unknown function [Pseudobutyrivibrio sp. YE44]
MGETFKSKGFKIAVFIIILVVAFGFIILGTLFGDIGSNLFGDSEDPAKVLDEKSLEDDSGNNIILMPKEEIYTFSMTDEDDVVLNFSKKGEGWEYTDNPNIKIDEKRIDYVLNYLSDVKYIDVIEGEDPEKYGLVKESPVAIITDSSDSSIFISFGNVDEKTGELYYAVNYDYSTIYVNGGKLGNVLHYKLEDLIKR